MRCLYVVAIAGAGAALCCAAPGHHSSKPPSDRTTTAPLAGDSTVVPYWHVNGQGWGRPAADAKTVYFQSRDRRLLAIDAETGQIRWQRNTGSGGASPSGSMVLVAGPNVVVGDESVLAFDRVSGAARWRFAPAEGRGAGAYLGQSVGARVYAGSLVGRVFAIDARTGRSLWTAIVANDGRTLVFEPTADEDLVVAGYGSTGTPNSGGVVALDARTGAERWRAAFPQRRGSALGTSSTGNPVLVDDVVVAASAQGVIYAFDRQTGSIRWSLPKVSGLPADYPMSPDFDFRPLARTGRALFAGSLTGYLLAYSLETQRELWRFAGPPYISVAFNITSDDRSVYVPYLGGRMVALNVANGRERWRTSEKAGAFSFPLLTTPERLYAASSTSGFYALRR